jgi:formylglycine-generating enzyme required for sulfatase activity
MRTTTAAIAAIMLLCLAIASQADVFNLGGSLTNLEVVTVGDPGNAGEPSGGAVEGGFGPAGTCGPVAYTYEIGKYEITAAQYCDFLNHKAASDPYALYNTYMWSKGAGCKISRSGISGSYVYSVAADLANRPVNYVSIWDAMRFANWLHNGQGNGSTETGSYEMNGYIGLDGRAIHRTNDATWVVPSEDEWYKAAYYKGGGVDAGYWIYPTQSNAIPSNVLGVPTDPGNNASYSDIVIGGTYLRTVVGEHENSESAYNTFDQGGNVWEWNETPVDSTYPTYRGFRGGAYGSTEDDMRASGRGNYNNPLFENGASGFRLARVVPVPVAGVSNRGVSDAVISSASSGFKFVAWGRVTTQDADYFTLDDGAGAVVTVFAPGYRGILTGNFASAKGVITIDGFSRRLNAHVWDVVKLQ